MMTASAAAYRATCGFTGDSSSSLPLLSVRGFSLYSFTLLRLLQPKAEHCVPALFIFSREFSQNTFLQTWSLSNSGKSFAAAKNGFKFGLPQLLSNLIQSYFQISGHNGLSIGAPSICS